MNRGQLTVLGMFALAAVAAVFAWSWNYSRGKRCLEFFGAEAAHLIRVGSHVEIVVDEGEPTIDISKAPGLLNARSSLLDDASYDWTAQLTNTPQIDEGVRFSRGQQAVTVSFDFEKKTITVTAIGKSARLNDKTAAGWQKFLSRQKQQPAGTTPPGPARTAPSE